MRCTVPSLLLLPLLAAGPAAQPDPADTRLLTDPALSAEQAAFVHDDDLWVAPREGGRARRITSAPGREQDPAFSPGGEWLAFSGSYDGNTDVYLVPTAGGRPRRLTWHPGADRVVGFSPDGQEVLFRSARDAFNNRYTSLFLVPLAGGFPRRLPLPHGHHASFSPDGRHLAYTPLAERCRQWKNYRGGTVSRIWILDRSTLEVREIPQPPGRCNDTEPLWLGGHIYFLSDRAGEFNLFAYRVADGAIEQLTRFTGFPVLHAAAGGGRILFEQAGRLHLFDPGEGRHRPLVFAAAAECREARPRWVAGKEHIRSAHISPSGARALFGCRGEVLTCPAEKGDPRNLTRTPGVHEQGPRWSPDGRWIACFSDEGGEYALHLLPAAGKGEVRRFALPGSGFYRRLRWSPDGKRIAFRDNALTLWVLHLPPPEKEEGKHRFERVAREELYSTSWNRGVDFAWSPDSRLLAYTHNGPTYLRTIHVHDCGTGKSFPLTDGMSDAAAPTFAASGRYLLFLASTDAGPVRQWFHLSNRDMEATYRVWLAVLPAGEPSPLAPESDEEEPAPEPGKGKKGKKKEEGKEPPPCRIDREGLDQRIVALPLPARRYGEIIPLPGDRILLTASEEGGLLVRWDPAQREAKTLLTGVGSVRLAAGGKKLLYRRGGRWYVAPAAKPGSAAQALDLEAIRLRIEPRREWRQIYHEAWRINRDFFYAPNFHGADWPAMRRKYEPFLAHLATRGDLNRVIRWLCSELAVGHHRVGGGERLERPGRVPGGLLGCDFAVEKGRYRFARIYGGLNWNPGLRAPLTAPGERVREGEYLLAVAGRPVQAPANAYSFFEQTAGRRVELEVGPDPEGRIRRTVTVVPLASELALRRRAWVEGNRRRVEEATGGRVAYVYVPDTSTTGHSWFKRYFYPQADRQAIIIDERFNQGGSVADYYIDLLRRPVISWWAMRHGRDLKIPSASIQGPKVMLIDETAGSGGDLLPWMFRRFELGPLVGKRTWGGLVGILGFPRLLDGGRVTAPNLAFWTPEEGFGVENVGVPPDIEVEQWPREVAQGRDPQLEKAIEVVLERLAKDPPRRPQRPPYPVRNPRAGGK